MNTYLDPGIQKRQNAFLRLLFVCLGTLCLFTAWQVCAQTFVFVVCGRNATADIAFSSRQRSSASQTIFNVPVMMSFPLLPAARFNLAVAACSVTAASVFLPRRLSYLVVSLRSYAALYSRGTHYPVHISIPACPLRGTRAGRSLDQFFGPVLPELVFGQY
jgi:hypothetical protein